VECLAVTAMAAVLLAIAVPLFSSALADGQRRSCRSTMQAIASAEQEYRQKNARVLSNGTVVRSYLEINAGVPLIAPARPDDQPAPPPDILRSPPRCPSGEPYTVSVDRDTGALTVRCPRHGDFVPGIDHE